MKLDRAFRRHIGFFFRTMTRTKETWRKKKGMKGNISIFGDMEIHPEIKSIPDSQGSGLKITRNLTSRY